MVAVDTPAANSWVFLFVESHSNADTVAQAFI